MPGKTNATIKDPYNLVEFESYHTAMTQPALAHIRDYWESLRAGRHLPLRSELDPRDLSPYLENCFILQHSGAGETRFRLAGMALNEIMGMELRGMPLRSIIMPEERGVFSAQLEQAFEIPEIQEYRLISDEANMPRLTARMLILPVKGDEANADRAIGCLTTEGIYGVPPRRFRVEELTRTSITTGKKIRTPAQAPAPAAKPPSDAQFSEGFREVQAPFAAETKVPYLRVVK